MQNTSSKKQASPRKRVSPAKKKLALEVIGRLKKEYPVAECTLDYENAWQLLVSVRLAAQCTDARVDQITPLLYEKFPDVPALAAAEPEQIEEIVRPCGLGRSKARDISACMRVLHEKYDDHVPETFEELLALGMVVEWLAPKYHSMLNTSQFFSNSDLRFFSQANHMVELKEMFSKAQTDLRKFIRDRGYSLSLVNSE